MKVIHSITVFWMIITQVQNNWVYCFIIPDEIPTLLSLIYSNIPTIKKGTDSRIGWGFRLGDRADFQVLVELGPQKDTVPLANQGDNANKRQAANTLSNELYAQAQRIKQEKEKITDTDGGQYIKQWRDSMKQTLPSTTSEDPTKFTLGIGEVDAKDYIPTDDVNTIKTPADNLEKLEELYKQKFPTTEKSKTTTSYKDALDNVELN